MMSRRPAWTRLCRTALTSSIGSRPDPIVSDSIDQLILRVRDRLDVTTVVVTHDMRSARRLGQRILMLHDGKIHAAGTPDEIFQSEDPVVRRFIDGVSDPKELYF